MVTANLSALRWRILALVFFATTINYLDRILLSVLIPAIRDDLHLSVQDYANLQGYFQLAYTVGFLVAGKFIDRFGTRTGYAVSIVWWSIAAGLHAVARSAFSLALWRSLLGFGEAGNFPAAIKSVAEWFPKKDRALATSIFNSGTNIASVVGPPVFAWLLLQFGWRSAFVFTASTGGIWVVLWLLLYRTPPAETSAEDAAEIQSIGWKASLAYPQTWGFAIGKFLTDPVWWFYLNWLPLYLFDKRHLNIQEIGWALPVVYTAASVGSVVAAWFTGLLIRRGWEAGRARRVTMAVCAFMMPVGTLAVFAPGVILAVLLVSVATAGHQGWSANLYSTTSDVFPKEAVASVTGIGGCTGGLGGYLFTAVITGFVVTHMGYTPIFVLMGSLHIISFFLMQRLLWRKKTAPVSARLS